MTKLIYKSRFKSAVKMHSEWIANPSGWRYRAERPAASRRKPQSTVPPRPEPRPAGGGPVVRETAMNHPKPPMGAADIITYPYPLRPGLVVQINLPPDLRSTEARRLAAFIESLVAEEQLTLPSADHATQVG